MPNSPSFGHFELKRFLLRPIDDGAVWQFSSYMEDWLLRDPTFLILVEMLLINFTLVFLVRPKNLVPSFKSKLINRLIHSLGFCFLVLLALWSFHLGQMLRELGWESFIH